MPLMRKAFLVLLVLVGCSSSNNNNTVDAPADTATTNVALDCPTYCTAIMTNCTAANAQYPDMAHCLGSCAVFVVGTSKVTDTTGNTLGCRINHAGAPAISDPALNCPQAGPGGDKLNAAAPGSCSGGDFCANFCALQIKTCGSMDAPITVTGTAIIPQYKNQAACESVCKNGDATVTPAIAKFDLTHLYATNSLGNSLACRLAHWTNAASGPAATPPSGATTQTHCGHTGAAQTQGSGLPCSSNTPTP
jgi:hypothetical protein